jgi:hypothetical protein
MFEGKARSLTYSGAPERLALPANIRLGWKGLQGTNTLAYYEDSQITSVKSFIILGPGDSVIKHFTAVYECSKKAGAAFATLHFLCNLRILLNKLECFCLARPSILV